MPPLAQHLTIDPSAVRTGEEGRCGCDVLGRRQRYLANVAVSLQGARHGDTA